MTPEPEHVRPNDTACPQIPEAAIASAAFLLSPKLKCVEFEQIAGGQKELAITHHGQVYRLILTRNDRLILQK